MTKPVSPQDLFELWQRMVNPGAYPMQSLMFPVLDAKELEKKIGELQVVEHWLKANVSMVQMTMKSLQFQLAMVKGGEKGLKAYADAAKPAQGGASPGPEASATPPASPPNPALWMWDLMTQAAQPATPKAAPKRKPRRKAA